MKKNELYIYDRLLWGEHTYIYDMIDCWGENRSAKQDMGKEQREKIR